MTKYNISCPDCKKEFIIDDDEFTALVKNMELEISRMTSILYKHKVPVSYKSHDHIYAVIRTLMRCCASFNSDIQFHEVDEKADREFEEMITACKDSQKEKGQLRAWTKRLGQRHYTRIGMSETICGMPMLGNNYASVIPESEQHECKECVIILEKQQHQETRES